LPFEACGFLPGWADGSDFHGIDVARPAGAAGSLDGFELSDREIARVTAYAADRGLAIVAMFHSHPSGFPDLSETDRSAIRHSQWPWILLTRSQAGGLELAAFAAGTAEPIEVRRSTNAVLGGSRPVRAQE
jgi:proteasome lid subunit RPN8/RPN11